MIHWHINTAGGSLVAMVIELALVILSLAIVSVACVHN